MRRKNKALLCTAFSFLLTANMNTAQLAPAVTDSQTGSAPLGDNKAELPMEAYKQFEQLVQQQKFDEAVTILKDVHKLDNLTVLKMTMMLGDREQGRAVLAKFTGKYQPLSEERQSLHDYATALARNQIFSESLAVLNWLYQSNPKESKVVNDYVVVLNWSGNNRAAVDLFEKERLLDAPAYVLYSVGGAYYQLEQYDKAVYNFGQAAAKGDRRAKVWQAQSYYRAGDAVAANSIYDALLKENPNDIEVYRSRGRMRMEARNYSEAVADFEKVLALSAGTENAAEIKRTVDYDMAIAYIKLGEESKAIALLKPYVDNGSADIFMQSDYVLALRLYEDYKTAIAEAQRLWPDWGKVPVFGLQAYADSYVRTGQLSKAIPIYEHIRKRDPNANGAKLGLAFSQMMSGKIDDGLKVYDELITADPTLADVALDDAYYFFSQGKFVAGSKLFELVVTRYPDNSVYRQEFAGSLADNDMPRDAFRQYKALANTKGGEATGLSGMTTSAVAVGDYRAASRAVSKLQEQYTSHVMTAEAVKAYEERRRGGAQFAFAYQKDYKGVESKVWQTNADQSINGSSYSILAALRTNKITDFHADPKESTTLNSQSVGIGYKGVRGDVQAWYHNYQNNGTFGGYSILTNYYPTDRLTFGFDVSRSPLEDVQALNPVLAGSTLGRIMTTNYTFRTQIISTIKDRFDLTYTLSNYSDDNRVKYYGINWTRTAVYNDKKELYWFLFWNQSDYKLQRTDIYESPTARDSYGFGITQRWNYSKHYWEATSVFEWGRDRPDPIDFQPALRLEYGYNFSPTRALVLAAEYGLRTDKLNNVDSLNFGNRRFEASYQFSW